jgi:hypothetical protein
MGALVEPGQLWELSKVWYTPRLDPGYAGRTKEQVAALFESVGLVDPFWSLG